MASSDPIRSRVRRAVSILAARSSLAASLTLAALLLLAAPASAQFSYFGKNKIQYEDFQWEILSSEHVDLYYYPAERELALLALEYAEKSYDELEKRFSYNPKDRIPLVLYASHQHFEQTNIVPWFLPEGVAGFTEFLKGRVALPFNGSYADFRHVIRHELVHVFQARKGGHLKRVHPGGNEWRSPSWFIEGLAEHWSTDWNAEGDLVVRDLLLNGEVPTVPELDRYAGSFAIYKLGQHLLGYLARTYGDEKLVELMESEWKYQTFSLTFRKVYGVDLDEVTEGWHRDLRERYFPALAIEEPIRTTATPVVTEGRLNFTPAVVPAASRKDGRPGVAYLSANSGYVTINEAELLETDEDIETRVTAGRSGDYESLHPLLSTIDVSRDGRMTFVAKTGGSDALYVHDVDDGDREARKQWEDLLVLSSPTWAPDGQRIAFVGLARNGFSDLYVWDMRTDELERLTNDRFLEATPDWSPMDETLVFASDRTPFGREGAKNLYLMDLASREIRPLTLGRWVDRDPDFSPDGSRIVFASDRADALDLYVVDRRGDGHRATAFAGGTMHPRWFRAEGKDQVVFTGFEGQEYHLYRADLSRSQPSTFALVEDSSIEGWHWEDELPDPERFVERPYEREFGLDFASAALAFADEGSRGEGAQMFFSDMLGDHLIIATVNSQQGRTNLLSGFTGSVTYINLKKRLNWGAAAYRERNFFSSLLGTEFSSGPLLNREGIGIRNDFFEERWGVSGLVSYPFSKFQRIDAELTFERNEMVELPDGSEDFSQPFFFRDAWLTIGSLGWVYDNTLWNAAGPIDGRRVNVQVSGYLNLSEGGIESTEIGVDARNYYRTSRNTTYAVRARGRASTGEIPTFYFLGGPLSLRGYPTYVLNGSYTALLNQEWRFPIIPPGIFREGMAALLANGVWGAAFVDLGNAWLEDGLYRDETGEMRELGLWPGLLGSYGVSLRYPLVGPFILRLDWAKRFDIEDKRNLFPGERDKTHFSFFVGYNY